MMDFRPLHDRVVIRRTEAADTKVGSIVIPDSAKEKPQQGEVVAVGGGRLMEGGDRAAVEVKPGDLILFGKYSGSEIKLGADEYLILREDEILAVLDANV
jgi:chaperonin GroES